MQRRFRERGEQRQIRRTSAEANASLHRSHLERHSGNPRARSESSKSQRTSYRSLRWWWRAPVLVILFAFFAAVLAGISALLAYSPLRKGLSAMNAAITAVRSSNSTRAVSDLKLAHGDFASAQAPLDAWWTKPAELIPGLGQQLIAVRAAASVGDQVSAAGIGLAPEMKLSHTSFGSVLVRRLAVLHSALGHADSVLVSAHRQLAAVNSPWLLSPLSSRLDHAITTLSRAQHDERLAAAGLQIARALVGANGPSRIFLAVDTPAEIRSGGGVVGNYGIIEGDNGHLALGQFGRDTQLNAAGDVGHRSLAGLTTFVARYGALQPTVYWQNVLASPDFPLDAQAIERLYPQSGGVPINGVVALDPFGLADLLKVVGPITVPSWPTPITAENAPSILLHQEYDRLSGASRVAFLGQVATTAWLRLSTGHLPGLSALAHALGPAIAGRHLMMASTNPAIERDLVALGAAGVMSRPKGADFLGVTDTNVTGNKIDYYLRRSIAYVVHVSSSGALRAKVTVTLHNLAPSSGQPPYVIGSVVDPTGPLGVNRTLVDIYTPWSFYSSRLNGQMSFPLSQREAGFNVYQTEAIIPSGGTATLTMTLTGRLAPHPRAYRLELFHQATVAPDNISLAVHPPSGTSLTTTAPPFFDKGTGIASAHFAQSESELLKVAFSTN